MSVSQEAWHRCSQHSDCSEARRAAALTALLRPGRHTSSGTRDQARFSLFHSGHCQNLVRIPTFPVHGSSPRCLLGREAGLRDRLTFSSRILCGLTLPAYKAHAVTSPRALGSGDHHRPDANHASPLKISSVRNCFSQCLCLSQRWVFLALFNP